MDVVTLIFVGSLGLVALFLTVTVRREIIAKERRHRGAYIKKARG